MKRIADEARMNKEPEENDASGAAATPDEPVDGRKLLSSVIGWMASNPIKTVSALTIMLGFCFELAFWMSNNDIPRLGFDDLTTTFSAAAVVGAFLLLCLVLPLFAPAIVWATIRTVVCDRLMALTKKPFSESDADEQWRFVLTLAAIGGAFTLLLVLVLAIFHLATAIVASLGATPLVCAGALVWRTWKRANWWETVVLTLLGAATGFGGAMVAIPLTVVIQLLASNGNISAPEQWGLLLIGPGALLFCCWAMSWRGYKPREFAALSAVATIFSISFILVPLNAHLYIAQAIARTLGQGAQRDVTILVTAEQCRRIRALSYNCACIGDDEGNYTSTLSVLNRQGDTWLVEIAWQNHSQHLRRLHISRDQILGDATSVEISAIRQKPHQAAPGPATQPAD